MPLCCHTSWHTIDRSFYIINLKLWPFSRPWCASDFHQKVHHPYQCNQSLQARTIAFTTISTHNSTVHQHSISHCLHVHTPCHFHTTVNNFATASNQPPSSLAIIFQILLDHTIPKPTFTTLCNQILVILAIAQSTQHQQPPLTTHLLHALSSVHWWNMAPNHIPLPLAALSVFHIPINPHLYANIS